MSIIDDFSTRFDNLREEIKESELDNSSIVELLHEVEEALENAQSDLAEAEFEERNMDDAIEPTPEGGLNIPQRQIDAVRNKVIECQKLVDELTSVRDDIDGYLSKGKVFDRNLCLMNIRTLLRKSDVKIGQIETQADVRIGYLSRLERPGCTTEPSIQFVATAAKMLNVTVDELMYAQITDLSEDEQTVKDFLSDLLKDTIDRNIHWNKLSSDILGKPHKAYEDPNAFHPMLTADPSDFDSDGTPNTTKFISDFYPESKIRAKDGTYYAHIDEISAEIYIVWCTAVVDDKYIPGQTFFEIYLIDGDQKRNTICTTVNAAPQIISAVGDLYKAAVSNSSQVYLNDNTKSLINHYRSLKNLPFF